MEQCSILLVDDHKLFREGLKLLLSNISFIQTISEAANGEEFLQLILKDTPDIVFMDIDMPVVDGIEATRKALEIYPELKIIALSMYGDENYYTRMINAGAKGFILKNSSIHDVEAAIKNVLSGNSFFSHEILSRIINHINKRKNIAKSSELSERESEVLYHICKGLSNQEIADTLFLSKRTIDKHRENLLIKTNSKNTAGLVIYAIKHGIVEI